MQIMKRFRDIFAETLGVGFARKATDLEQNKHGNEHIEWFDDGAGGVALMDFQKRKRNPTYSQVLEAIDKPVYDTVVIVSASTTSADFFTAQQGSGSKTAMETNLQASRQLPAPEKFTIKRLGLLIQTDTLADMKAVMYQTLFTFSVNSKQYTQAPSFYFPAGMGIHGQTTVNASNIVTNGIPGENGVRSLIYEIPLSPLDPFQGNLAIYGGGSVGTRALGSLTLTATIPVVCLAQGPYERAI